MDYVEVGSLLRHRINGSTVKVVEISWQGESYIYSIDDGGISKHYLTDFEVSRYWDLIIDENSVVNVCPISWKQCYDGSGVRCAAWDYINGECPLQSVARSLVNIVQGG